MVFKENLDAEYYTLEVTLRDVEREAFTVRTGITSDDLRGLGRVQLFAGLKTDDICKLLATSSVRRYPDQTSLFQEGDPAKRFFVILDGWVKLYRLCEDGQEVVISVISPCESFAEAAIFDSKVYPVSAATISDTRILSVNAEAMMGALRDNMDLTFNILASMSRQMRKNITLLHQLSAMSTTERLADFLLGLCGTNEGEAKITLPMDKSLIAARLGMQPETFSRALAKLKSSGVSTLGQDVIIKDVRELRHMIQHNGSGCC